MSEKKILITGCAGFIGFHLAQDLCKNKNLIIYGIDNLSSYYDTKLKKRRLKILKINKNFIFSKIDVVNDKKITHFILKNNFYYVIHLAAQAGVRYSILNPRTYLKNNIDGFFNILDAFRVKKPKHFLFASTSSVYGSTKKFPLTEKMNTDNPQSFYAATKKTNEIMAYAYANIYKIPTTGLRLFTVYGPYGRPDMALFKFANSIKKKLFLDFFNNGNHYRDFTYISDVINYITKLVYLPPKNKIPFRIFNVANGRPRSLKEYLKIIEKELNNKAKIKKLPLQQGDIFKTHASNKSIEKLIGKQNKTPIEKGIKKYLQWFNQYYQ